MLHQVEAMKMATRISDNGMSDSQKWAVILVILAFAFVIAAACGYLFLALVVLFALAKPILVAVMIGVVDAIIKHGQRKAK